MSEPMDPLEKLRPPKPLEAREQAAEYLGFMTGIQLDLGDGQVFEVPNSGLLDDDQQIAYDQLQASLDDCDHEDVEIRDDDGKVVRTESRLKDPHRKDGKLLEPYNIRLCKALFGEQGYQRFKAAGGRASDVGIYWTQMNRQLQERRLADAKSRLGDSTVGAVPAGD
jgi:hypothetical protein